MGVALPDVPFDERKGIIPNIEGRVINPATTQAVIGEYVVGWIKRGPSGIIGTNKPDSQATVNKLLEDAANRHLLQPQEPARDALDALVRERQPNLVTYSDWLIIDAAEQERGQALGRPRLKFDSVEEMLAALAERKSHPNPAGD
jgi:ferredoxin--NADP+ reductase